LHVRSKSRNPKLVGNRCHVLVALEQSTFVDMSHFGICRELWKYIKTLQILKNIWTIGSREAHSCRSRHMRNFKVQGIIREEERLLTVHSKSQKSKLVGNRWHVLVELEGSTLIDILRFDDCKICDIAS